MLITIALSARLKYCYHDIFNLSITKKPCENYLFLVRPHELLHKSEPQKEMRKLRMDIQVPRFVAIASHLRKKLTHKGNFGLEDPESFKSLSFSKIAVAKEACPPSLCDLHKLLKSLS